MVVLSQAIEALWLLTLLQAVLGDVPPLAAAKALHQSTLLILSLHQALEVAYRPVPFTLLFPFAILSFRLAFLQFFWLPSYLFALLTLLILLAVFCV